MPRPARAALDSLLADLRYGWRTLRRTPGSTAVAAAPLGVGTGASTAIFSLADAALLGAAALPALAAPRLPPTTALRYE